MSWKNQNSLKRIFEAFKRNKASIYTSDIEALKHINSELENAIKSNAVDNILFTKLLCITLNKELLHSRDINSAKNRIYSQLSEPMGYHLQIFKQSLESVDKINFFKSKGFDMEFGSNDDLDKIKANEKDLINKLLLTWPLEKVEKSVYNTANDLIKNIDNYA